MCIVILFNNEGLTLVSPINQICWWPVLCFCLSGEVLISSSFLKISFVGYRILSWKSFSFSTLMFYFTAFWHLWLFMRNQIKNLIVGGLLGGDELLLSCCCNIVSLSLTLESLVVTGWSVELFKFILLGICWTSWIHRY